MTDPQALLARLHPPRLPEAMTSPGLAELLTGFGLGLLLALTLLGLVAGLRRGLGRPARPAVLRLAALERRLATLPPEARLLEELALLAALGSAPAPATRAALYRGETPVLTAELRAAWVRLGRRDRRHRLRARGDG